MSEQTAPAIWFPAVRTGTGTDVFTERLVAGLQARGYDDAGIRKILGGNLLRTWTAIEAGSAGR